MSRGWFVSVQSCWSWTYEKSVPNCIYMYIENRNVVWYPGKNAQTTLLLPLITGLMWQMKNLSSIWPPIKEASLGLLALQGFLHTTYPFCYLSRLKGWQRHLAVGSFQLFLKYNETWPMARTWTNNLLILSCTLLMSYRPVTCNGYLVGQEIRVWEF